MQFAKAIPALIVVGASCLLLSVAVPRAQAQFDATYVANAETGPEAKKPLFSVAFYPYAPFQTGYALKVAPSTGIDSQKFKETANGLLLAPEVTFLSHNGKSSYGIGAWYWLRTSKKEDGSDYFEVHGKYYFTPNVGIQIGYLGNSSNEKAVGEKGVNGYVTYKYSSPRKEKAKSGSFGVTAGLGIQSLDSFEDVFKTSALFSGFLSGGYEVTKGLSVNLSYLLITGDRKLTDVAKTVFDKVSADKSRFAVGVSYQF